jgi:hypothetical protein
MKKSDLKNLAIMGITGGLMISAQGSATEQHAGVSDSHQYLAQHSCGGHGGCGGKGNGDSNTKGNGNRSMHMHQNGADSHKNGMMAEGELYQKLDARHRAMYNAMSPEGKQLARKLAGQSKSSFEDKNQAVEVANSRMQEKRSSMIQTPQSGRNP